jgi:hypothetical protein
MRTREWYLNRLIEVNLAHDFLIDAARLESLEAEQLTQAGRARLIKVRRSWDETAQEAGFADVHDLARRLAERLRTHAH